MSVLGVLGIVALAGAFGGVIAAVLSEDRGFVLPSKVPNNAGNIIRPGIIGLMLVGAAAAALSFALYGPLASETIVGGAEAADAQITSDDDSEDYGLTLAALGGAVLVGIGGSKWLSSQVDKAVLQVAASTAAGRPGDNALASQIANAAPSEALRLATTL